LVLTAWVATAQTGPANTNDYRATIAASRGWLTNYTRGLEIIRQVAALSPEQQEKLKGHVYRGEKVAFAGVGGPAASEDLMTEKHFYIRVVYPEGKKPPPRTTKWWESLVRGTITGVLPENRIIILEFDEEQPIQGG
jgi:hypothetical protein